MMEKQGKINKNTRLLVWLKRKKEEQAPVKNDAMTPGSGKI